MTVGEKIRELRKKAGLTQKELGKLSNTSETTIKQYELGKRQPRLEQLKRIAKVLNIYVGELLADNYEEYKEQIIADFSDTVSHISENATTTTQTLYGNAEKSNRMNSFFEMLNDAGQEKAIDQVELLTKIPEYQKEYAEKAKERTLQRNAHTSNIRLVNYYYRLASAGTGQIVFDMPPTEKIEIPDIPEYKKVDYAIGVNGNSMEPEFSNGDILLIEMTEDINIGEIGIFIVDNESYVKKLGHKELISLNPDYKNIPLTENSKCMGKVVDKLQNNN